MDIRHLRYSSLVVAALLTPAIAATAGAQPGPMHLEPKLAVVGGDLIAFRKRPGRGIAGNSRSDNRDPHPDAPFLLCSGDTAGREAGFKPA